jgi:hypothetical protein
MKTIIKSAMAIAAVYVMATGVMTALFSQERGTAYQNNNTGAQANLQAAKDTERFLDNLNEAAVR